MIPRATILFISLFLEVGTGLSQTQQPAASTKPGFTLADLKAQIQQDRDGVFLMELSDIIHTATDPEVRGLLQGQPVATTAQVTAEAQDNAGASRLRLFRSQILCCASHLRQYCVSVECVGKAPTFKDRAWVRVVGTLSYQSEDGKVIPFILAKEVKEIASPPNPLLK